MLHRLRDVFASLNSHDVHYLVIGGVAASLHGVPRGTFDLDILIEATRDNAQRLLDALAGVGFGTASLTSADQVLADEITIFQDRVKVDVQTATPGLSFPEAWERRETMSYRGQDFYVVCREDLIASKVAANRAVDQDDVRKLRLVDEDDGADDSA
ncbi:MAG: nucleotidyltransferase [Candidatus Brocadiae bacterium]|nr:nucleotidyltransferase [Candidatus Brocadiia bacterium]